MDDPAIGHDVKDTDMSEASASDPELALGEFLCSYNLHIRNTDIGMDTLQDGKIYVSHGALKCCMMTVTCPAW